MKAAGSRAIGKGAGVGRTDASTGRLRGRAREAFRQCFSFRWVAAAVIVLVWFVYFPVVDNFIIQFDAATSTPAMSPMSVSATIAAFYTIRWFGRRFGTIARMR